MSHGPHDLNTLLTCSDSNTPQQNYAQIHTHACKRAHTYTRRHIRRHKHTQTRVHKHTHTKLNTNTHKHTTHTHTHTHTHTNTNTHTHTHEHTRTYTHAHKGYKHNAVAPVGYRHELPLILSHSIAELQVLSVSL